jgi:hypothetical protein
MCQLSGPPGVAPPDGPGEPTNPERNRFSVSQITQLASGAITAVDTITIELVEADETPAVVIVRWPDKPTVLAPATLP